AGAVRVRPDAGMVPGAPRVCRWARALVVVPIRGQRGRARGATGGDAGDLDDGRLVARHAQHHGGRAGRGLHSARAGQRPLAVARAVSLRRAQCAAAQRHRVRDGARIRALGIAAHRSGVFVSRPGLSAGAGHSHARLPADPGSIFDHHVRGAGRQRDRRRALCLARSEEPRMNRKASFGAAVLIAFALVALVGPLLVGDPSEPVDVPLLPPSAHHWLGTTGQGQDVLAQTIAGARSSLAIGIITGFLVVALGALVGTTAAFFGGWVDELLGLGINLFLLMPGLPLMVVIAAYLPPSAMRTVFVLVFAGWAW